MKKKMFCTVKAVMCAAVMSALVLTGCGGGSGSGSGPDTGLMHTDISSITVPDQVQVVGLGEASHGAREFQELKGQVFQALVKNNGCRTFIIEGDFGAALKVDNWIHGGEGTAREAASWIGFRIYRTEEMEAILEWMRAYNETAAQGEDLHFYGMDMQWADGSKEYLANTLGEVSPQVWAKYEQSLAFLNDGDMYDIPTDAFEQGMAPTQELIEEVDRARELIEEKFGKEVFAFARECACSLHNCCDIRKSDAEYNQVRDGHMTEKVKWFLEQGDGSLLFINGHNGHISRTNTTPWYDCMGKRLGEELGQGYFSIGTDAAVTHFNSQMDVGFKEMTVENENELNLLAKQTREGFYYLDFSEAEKESGWNEILSGKLRITSLNVGGVINIKAFCTAKIVPGEAFDGMIIFDQVSPTTLN